MPDKTGKKIKILGLSAYYHDSAAALVIDGEIVAAAHEERFTRKKHDDSFPRYSANFVLSEFGLEVKDLDAVVFYDKPYIKFERLLETYHTFAPRGIRSFLSAMPVWVKEKIFTSANIKKELVSLACGEKNNLPPLFFSEHHLSHAASAFYPSPFQSAAIMTVDGVGEWATATIGKGRGKDISILREMRFPHSLGLLYSAFTYYTGFMVNSGEYKLMGLAPYGKKDSVEVARFKGKIFSELISMKEDGSIALNMDYFDFATGLKMCRDDAWEKLFGFPPRKPESEITENYMNLALAIQEVTEESMLNMAMTAKKLTGEKNLVMAGGVALNCVANEKIKEAGIFDNVWVEPASGDAGGALGAALAAYHIYFGRNRVQLNGRYDLLGGSYLGPEFGEKDILKVIRKYSAPHQKFEKFFDLTEKTAEIISSGYVVGWFQGKMEWGPRALGNRSIFGDPRNKDMQKKLNLKIKYREGFRPFAPVVKEEDVSEYFETHGPSPYMLFTVPVKKERRMSAVLSSLSLTERLYTPRSDIPAVTHLDYSARIQTVSRKTNDRLWLLLDDFKKKTGCGVLINTSFNVRGEPIVCTPEDAYLCFMNTEMDYLVMGDYFFDKAEQTRNLNKPAKKYELD